MSQIETDCKAVAEVLTSEQMFNHHLEQARSRLVIFHWFMLSFNGGFINAGGFLATGWFVSHVTGFATLFGVDLANQQFNAALGILSVPFFFLLGSFIAGILIDRPLYQGKAPRFDWVMGLASFCLIGAVVGGHFLHFGDFGNEGISQNYYLLILLCLASGLQNGAITSSSGKTIRTTHLTGLTTDLGLGLARVFVFKLNRTNHETEVAANHLRIGSILSFIFGSALGAWLFLQVGYLGFIFPAMITSYAGWYGRKTKLAHRPDQSSL